MGTVHIPFVLCKQLQAKSWVRNGRFPDASMYALLTSQTNYLLKWRCKEVFGMWTPIQLIPARSGTRTRWRFAFTSSPMARYVYVVMWLASSPGATDSYARLTIRDSGGAVVGTADVHAGTTAGSAPDTPAWMSIGTQILNDGTSPVEIPGAVDLYGEVTDQDSRIVAITVYEEAFPADSGNGYIEGGFAVQQPIFDGVRQQISNQLTSQWKFGAAHVEHWTVDQDASVRTRTANTAINLVDNTSTTPSSSTPGVTLDLLQKGSERRGTVPCVLQAYGGMSAGGSFGHVELVDSSNVVVGDVLIQFGNAWRSSIVNLPATVAKYDLRFKSDGVNTCSVYAASLYQFEA